MLGSRVEGSLSRVSLQSTVGFQCRGLGTRDPAKTPTVFPTFLRVLRRQIRELGRYYATP